MSRTYNRDHCQLCGKLISNAGVAYYNHMKYHERLGDLTISKNYPGSGIPCSWDYDYTQQGWEKAREQAALRKKEWEDNRAAKIQ